MNKIVVCVLGIALSLGSLYAQSHPGQAQRRLEQFKKLRLIEVLDLDEKTAEKFFVRYNEGQKQIDRVRRELRAAIDSLQEALRVQVPESELTTKSDAVLAHIQELSRAVTERLSNIRPLLSPKQFAKLIVFESRFLEALQRAALRHADQQNMPRRRRPMSPPLEEPY